MLNSPAGTSCLFCKQLLDFTTAQCVSVHRVIHIAWRNQLTQKNHIGQCTQADELERKRAECAAAVASKKEEAVDLLQERARDRASIRDKELLALKQARRAPTAPHIPCPSLLSALPGSSLEVMSPAALVLACCADGSSALPEVHEQSAGMLARVAWEGWERQSGRCVVC